MEMENGNYGMAMANHWRGDPGVGTGNRDSQTAKARKPSIKASTPSRLGQLGKEVHDSRITNHETVERDEERKNAMNIYSIQNTGISCVTKRRRFNHFVVFF
jgi:hypothetical protein